MKLRISILSSLLVSVILPFLSQLIYQESGYATINFQTNGGQVLAPLRQLIGTSFTLPESEKEGHSFVSWYKNQALTEEFNETIIPKNDLTLFASWVINQYTITFVTNGGNILESITGNYGEVIPEFAVPVKENFEFALWFEDSTLTKPFDYPERFPAKDLRLYASWVSGNGTPEVPYLISKTSDLEIMRSKPNASFLLANNISVPFDFEPISIFNGSLMGSNFMLTIKNKAVFERLSINSTVRNLRVIIDLGESLSLTLSKPYYGFFTMINEGSISNLLVTYTSSTVNLNYSEMIRKHTYYVGLIGKNEGNVQDVTLSGNSLLTLKQTREGFNFGTLVGYNSGALENIQNINVNINSESLSVGGVIGYSDGTLTSLVNRASITNKIIFYQDNWTSYTGGIAAGIGGSSSNIYNYGNISVSSTSDFVNVGGIAGYISSEISLIISDIYNYGIIKGHNPYISHEGFMITLIGGITSFLSSNVRLENAINNGSISNVYNNLKNFSSLIGGLVGRNDGTIYQSYNLGNLVLEDQKYVQVGGVSGRNYGTITESLNKGNISSLNTSASSYIGGISGSLHGGFIGNSYNRGSISLTNQSTDFASVAGGIVGLISENLNSSTIQGVYSASNMEGAATNWFGGIVGKIEDTQYTINNAHYFKNNLIKHGVATNELVIGASYSAISSMYQLSHTLGLIFWVNVTNNLTILKWENE